MTPDRDRCGSVVRCSGSSGASSPPVLDDPKAVQPQEARRCGRFRRSRDPTSGMLILIRLTPPFTQTAETGWKMICLGEDMTDVITVYGIDFTSRPSRRKPITCLECRLVGDSLRLVKMKTWTTFGGFEAFLATNSDGQP